MDVSRAADLYLSWVALKRTYNELDGIMKALDLDVCSTRAKLLKEVAKLVVDDGANIYCMAGDYKLDVKEIEQEMTRYKAEKVYNG